MQRKDKATTMPTEIKVLSTTAMKTTLDALAGELERAGYTINPAYGPSPRIAQRVADGEAADVAIITAAAHGDLTRQGKLVPGIRYDVAKSSIAVGVRAGAPRPDISTPEKFKQAMLAAKSVGMSNPVGGGMSGGIVQRAFEQLGIWDAMKGKLTFGPGGPAGLVGFFLVRNEVEIGIQQNAELMAVPGVDIVGPLPGELQVDTVFSLGAMTNATHAGAAKAVGEVLRSPAGIAAVKKMGHQSA